MEPIIVDGIEVKSGQIWRTKTGNLVLVVNVQNQYLGLVWFDSIDQDINVCKVMNQLETPVHPGVNEKWLEILTRASESD